MQIRQSFKMYRGESDILFYKRGESLQIATTVALIWIYFKSYNKKIYVNLVNRAKVFLKLDFFRIQILAEFGIRL